MAVTKRSVPSKCVGNKPFCACPETVRSGGSSTCLLDPRTTKLSCRAAGQAGGTDADVASSPGVALSGRGERRTGFPACWPCQPCPPEPRPVLSCPVGAPEDSVGTSPQRSAQPLPPHTALGGLVLIPSYPVFILSCPVLSEPRRTPWGHYLRVSPAVPSPILSLGASCSSYPILSSTCPVLSCPVGFP